MVVIGGFGKSLPRKTLLFQRAEAEVKGMRVLVVTAIIVMLGPVVACSDGSIVNADYTGNRDVAPLPDTGDGGAPDASDDAGRQPDLTTDAGGDAVGCDPVVCAAQDVCTDLPCPEEAGCDPGDPPRECHTFSCQLGACVDVVAFSGWDPCLGLPDRTEIDGTRAAGVCAPQDDNVCSPSGQQETTAVVCEAGVPVRSVVARVLCARDVEGVAIEGSEFLDICVPDTLPCGMSGTRNTTADVCRGGQVVTEVISTSPCSRAEGAEVPDTRVGGECDTGSLCALTGTSVITAEVCRDGTPRMEVISSESCEVETDGFVCDTDTEGVQCRCSAGVCGC